MNFHHKVTAIDLHACGEPGRVITGGFGDVPGRQCSRKDLSGNAHRRSSSQNVARSSRVSSVELQLVATT